MKPEPAKPTAIILAAGEGKRYEGTKQLVQISGKPLLQYVLDAVRNIDWSYKPLLVLGYEGERVMNAVNTEGIRVVENDKWDEGMSTSLKCGVDETDEDSSGFVFFLADMPLINTKIIKKVLERAADGASIVAPSFHGERGFPVYLHRKWKNHLLEDVSGDKGAREIIAGNRGELTLVPTDDRGVIMDLNEKSDLTRIKSYLAEEGTQIGV